MKSLEERFEEKHIPEPNSGCWLWIGSYDRHGYGQIRDNWKLKAAHRVSYELYRREIPEGMDIDHKCRVPCCVNPYHLEPVTRSENLRRGNTGEYFKKINGSRTHCIRGHSLHGDNLYINPDGERQCRECGRARCRKSYYRRKQKERACDEI